MQKRSGDKGFTLVELAIVLVIIGIIIGAVLRGQQMIESAKLKKLYNQQREIIAAIYIYYDKYGKFPGDDNNAATRWTGTTSGNNDGQIGISVNLACTDGDTTESCQAWQHMRNALLITGSAASAVYPTNAYGSAIGVGYDTGGTLTGLAANWIGFVNVPYDACQSIDLQYDDGLYNTGSIRGTADYGAATSGNFDLYFRL